MTLSGGEKQRILLAKALAQVSVEDASLSEDKYPLLDEPTASLDLKQAQTVMRILRAAADSGIGVVLVIHDIASVRRYGDTVFLLKDGGVAYAGEPKLVLTAGRIADSFDVDFETAEGSISVQRLLKLNSSSVKRSESKSFEIFLSLQQHLQAAECLRHSVKMPQATDGVGAPVREVYFD